VADQGRPRRRTEHELASTHAPDDEHERGHGGAGDRGYPEGTRPGGARPAGHGGQVPGGNGRLAGTSKERSLAQDGVEAEPEIVRLGDHARGALGPAITPSRDAVIEHRLDLRSVAARTLAKSLGTSWVDPLRESMYQTCRAVLWSSSSGRRR